MAATKRIQRELEDLKNFQYPTLRNVQETSALTCEGYLVPQNYPYKGGAFKIEISYPVEYPFKPLKITFKTKIYHPNIDEKGEVSLPILTFENWRPANKTDIVIIDLLAIINDPEPEFALRRDLAEEFLNDRVTFNKHAEDYTKQYAEKLSIFDAAEPTVTKKKKHAAEHAD